ncbi:hypothetical protein LMG33818_000338 [Halomonadaceae bacterium LMG 33818]
MGKPHIGKIKRTNALRRAKHSTRDPTKTSSGISYIQASSKAMAQATSNKRLVSRHSLCRLNDGVFYTYNLSSKGLETVKDWWKYNLSHPK